MLVVQLNFTPRIDEAAALEEAVTVAASADVAIVVVGTNDEIESEGFDRDDLALPSAQNALVEAVADANPRTIVVVNSGAPVLLPWADRVAAVLLSWFPGQEFGDALADVLFGRVEPGGRLPTTWPASEEGLPVVTPSDGELHYDEGLFVGYRAFDRDGREPLFAFGHGLGYTSWELGDLEVRADAELEVSLDVANTGVRAGREVVQVYASKPDSAVERPVRWLVGFGAATAGPGERVRVAIDVPRRGLAHWDGGGWTVEPGEWVLEAGRSSRELSARASFTVR
jgi:beta-glucosidase